MTAPPPPRPPSRTSSVVSQDNARGNVQHAAYHGAATAFGRPPPKPRMPSNTYTGANGALAAATTAGLGSKSPSPRRVRTPSRSPAAPVVPTWTGDSVRSDAGGVLQNGWISSLRATPTLQPPPSPQRGHQKSPSMQAASLAAARAPPPTAAASPRPRAKTTHRPTLPPKPRRLSGRHRSMSDSKSTDSTPIAPTTSLVELFERQSSDPLQTSAKVPEPVVIKPSSDLPLRSPKPVRTSGGINSIFQMEVEDRTKRLAPETVHDVSSTSQNDALSSSGSDSYASASEGVEEHIPAITVRKRASLSPRPPIQNEQHPPQLAPRRNGVSPSPLRHSSTGPIKIQHLPSRSATSPVNSFSPSSASLTSIAARFNQSYPRKMTPTMTGDQLANAMVASSLASSRAPSPRRLEPPPLPTRHHKGHTFSFSRTPSPSKPGMRQTLRKAETEDESETEDELHPFRKHKKKRLVRKHPNKHHEGDRKRWREAVTERERKRYEGVWAANKGLHYSFTPEERSRFAQNPKLADSLQSAAIDQVSSIVVRDIWARSRLPDAVLETIWDLVDNDCVGRLSKDEFVVGTWLVDQSLKGRKLPVKVSESVWASVRGLQGIKIRK